MQYLIGFLIALFIALTGVGASPRTRVRMDPGRLAGYYFST